MSFTGAPASYRKDRDAIRQTAGDMFFEIYLSASPEVCALRDPKGHYRKAVSGEILSFTGVSAPHEPPLAPDLLIESRIALRGMDGSEGVRLGNGPRRETVPRNPQPRPPKTRTEKRPRSGPPTTRMGGFSSLPALQEQCVLWGNAGIARKIHLPIRADGGAVRAGGKPSLV